MNAENNMVINLLEQEDKHQENLKEVHALIEEKQLGEAEAIIATPYNEELHNQIKASIQILKQSKSKDAHIEALEAKIRNIKEQPILSVGDNDPIMLFPSRSENTITHAALGFIRCVLEAQLSMQHVLAGKGIKLSLGLPNGSHIDIEYDKAHQRELRAAIKFLDSPLLVKE